MGIGRKRREDGGSNSHPENPVPGHTASPTDSHVRVWMRPDPKQNKRTTSHKTGPQIEITSEAEQCVIEC